MTDTINKLLSMNENAFYLFDSNELRRRTELLRNSLPKGTMLCYAVKANPFITKEAAYHVERLEICSSGEAEICRSLGIDSSKMVISGVYKSPELMRELASDKCFDGIITVESVLQYRQLCTLSEEYGNPLKILPRLTNGSQFGLDETDLDMTIAERENHPKLDIVGVQFFSGTQKTSIKKYARELSYLDGYILSLKERFGFTARELEYGTGFPVSYFSGESLDEESLLREFSSLLENMECKASIIIESGRSIAASCGKYFTHIVDIKKNKEVNYALTDGGLHHITYFGQYMAMKQPFMSVVGKEDAVPDKEWTVCGALCTMNDIMVKQVSLPEITVGDVLCFERAGAYCMTEGISLLLSRDLPAVYILREDCELYCVRPSFETSKINMPEYERI